MVYKQYVELLSINVKDVQSVYQIPFLPIRFFKNADLKIVSTSRPVEDVFMSSGTTGMIRSKHLVFDSLFYQKAALLAFEKIYGSITNFEILAMLPNYQDNPNSSLIKMIEYFIDQSKSEFSAFQTTNSIENALMRDTKRVKLVIGVSFALLDLAMANVQSKGEVIVMETGGMKGRRKEMVRGELHQLIKEGLRVNEVHSEYGMTELFSQAYSKSNGIFQTPSWMKIIVRDTYDPFSYLTEGRGGINVIDLANVDTCAFIETEDLGKIHPNGMFEVLGRFDHSDVRGCNLMAL